MTGWPPRTSCMAYGLSIESEIVLPEAASAPSAHPDVVIARGDVPESLDGAPTTTEGEMIGGPQGLIRVSPFARLLVSGGRDVRVHQHSDVPDSAIVPFLLGSAAGLLLHQRGVLPLHGSAVAIGDEAAVFVGPRGSGKSTMAGLLHRRGYLVLSDDICAVCESNGGFAVHAGPAFLKLHADAFDIVAGRPAPVDIDRPKHRYPFERPMEWEPRRIRAVYLLGVGARAAIEDLPAAHAISVLRRFTYRRRYLAPTGRVRDNFEQCATLARAVAVRGLWRTPDWSSAGALLDGLTAELTRAALSRSHM